MGIAYGQVWGRKHNNVQPLTPTMAKTDPVAEFLKMKQRSERVSSDLLVKPMPCMKGLPWSEDERKLLANKDIPFETVSKINGRPYYQVTKYAKEHGYPRPASRYKSSGGGCKWTAEEDRLITDTGLTVKEIADLTGRTEKAVELRILKLAR